MYECETHGALDCEWCEDCGEIKSCNCSKLEITRFKDLIIDCLDGEVTITAYVEHCQQCGEIFDIRTR